MSLHFHNITAEKQRQCPPTWIRHTFHSQPQQQRTQQPSHPAVSMPAKQQQKYLLSQGHFSDSVHLAHLQHAGAASSIAYTSARASFGPHAAAAAAGTKPATWAQAPGTQGQKFNAYVPGMQPSFESLGNQSPSASGAHMSFSDLPCPAQGQQPKQFAGQHVMGSLPHATTQSSKQQGAMGLHFNKQGAFVLPTQHAHHMAAGPFLKPVVISKGGRPSPATMPTKPASHVSYEAHSAQPIPARTHTFELSSPSHSQAGCPTQGASGHFGVPQMYSAAACTAQPNSEFPVAYWGGGETFNSVAASDMGSDVAAGRLSPVPRAHSFEGLNQPTSSLANHGQPFVGQPTQSLWVDTSLIPSNGRPAVQPARGQKRSRDEEASGADLVSAQFFGHKAPRQSSNQSKRTVRVAAASPQGACIV